jgi:hypothetical protein
MALEILCGILVGLKLGEWRLCGREFLLHLLCLLAAKQPPFTCVHIPGGEHCYWPSGQSLKYDECVALHNNLAERSLTVAARMRVQSRDRKGAFGSYS